MIDNKTRDEDPMVKCMDAISGLSEKIDGLPAANAAAMKGTTDEDAEQRSEERRVGKDRRYRWLP